MPAAAVSDIAVACVPGAESVLYSFGSGSNGQYPFGSLIQASDGNFYGMTYAGGAYGYGAVFTIN
jgi:hypothetical protein